MSKHAIGLCLLLEDAVQTFCALALRQNPTRQYGSFNEMQLGFNEQPGLLTCLGTVLPRRDPERGRVGNLQLNAGREALSWMWSTIGRNFWPTVATGPRKTLPSYTSSSEGQSCRKSTTETATRNLVYPHVIIA